jgi:hypothetical protein
MRVVGTTSKETLCACTTWLSRRLPVRFGVGRVHLSMTLDPAEIHQVVTGEAVHPSRAQVPVVEPDTRMSPAGLPAIHSADNFHCRQAVL